MSTTLARRHDPHAAVPHDPLAPDEQKPDPRLELQRVSDKWHEAAALYQLEADALYELGALWHQLEAVGAEAFIGLEAIRDHFILGLEIIYHRVRGAASSM